jgi:hypothetical protein
MTNRKDRHESVSGIACLEKDGRASNRDWRDRLWAAGQGDASRGPNSDPR